MIYMIVFVLIASISIFIIVESWYWHVDTVKKSMQEYNEAYFEWFKKEFDKYDWEYERKNYNSLFDDKHNSQIHGGIIEFNKIGMAMKTPFDWCLVHLYVWSYILKNYILKKNKV